MLSTATGVIHFIASIIALISGSIVLGSLKGTRLHKLIGYVYTVSMAVLLATAFMIYKLHGSFGVLHWFAVISLLSLLCGIIPMIFELPRNYLTFHFSFMYWSVIGLYCAFFAEILTRLPFLLDIENNLMYIFYALVGVATAAVGGIGSYYFKRYKKIWSNFED